MIEYINDIDDAPSAIGPYSQATRCGEMIFLSGQIPVDPATGKLVEGGIEEQANQVLKNLSTVLGGLELAFSDVVKSTIYLTDLGNFTTVNEIYARWLNDVQPARATVEVRALPLGAQIEIDMIAVKKDEG